MFRSILYNLYYKCIDQFCISTKCFDQMLISSNQDARRLCATQRGNRLDTIATRSRNLQSHIQTSKTRSQMGDLISENTEINHTYHYYFASIDVYKHVGMVKSNIEP